MLIKGNKVVLVRFMNLFKEVQNIYKGIFVVILLVVDSVYENDSQFYYIEGFFSYFKDLYKRLVVGLIVDNVKVVKDLFLWYLYLFVVNDVDLG